MSKAVLISIQPQWCELIANGKKTIEVRKTKPAIKTPFKCLIYCTKGKPLLGRCLRDNSLKGTPEIDFDNFNRDTLFKANGKVIGGFVCSRVGVFPMQSASIKELSALSCVDIESLLKYAGKSNAVYGWHISDLVIYDKPMDLQKFYKPCPNPELMCGICHYGERNYMDGGIERHAFIKSPPQSWCYVDT